MTAEEIVFAALKLDKKARAELAHQLIVSLDEELEGLTDAEWEAAWVAEAERRLADMREGKVKGVPGEQVFARARARLNS